MTHFVFEGAVGFRTHPYFNPESSRVLLDQVLCLRSENSLSECSSRPFGVAGSSCRTRPAAVICPSSKSLSFNPQYVFLKENKLYVVCTSL